MDILIIDDEKNIGIAIKEILEDEGHACEFCLNYSDGFKRLKEKMFNIVFLDIWLPDMDGVDGLKEIKRYFPETEVIMISGHGTIETAVETIRYGAYDFLEKPLSLDRITMAAKHLSDKLSILGDLRKSKFDSIKKYDLVGVSDAISRLKDKIERIAAINSWVLITGENGTGKEHVARLIHMLGKRSNKPFVEINCSAVPTDLIESEMFGHEKGAFTGSVQRKVGKFELADEGTLFLDEIGDMGLPMQAKLLRILETGEFSRLGSNDTIKSNFRLISATNKNLPAEIAANRFRSDLYYRINVIPVEVPPLRERRDDIAPLVNYFLKETSLRNGIKEKQFSDDLMRLFTDYSWPGNVRQLKNTVERIAVLSESDTLDLNDAPSLLLGDEQVSTDSFASHNYPLKEARDEFEKNYILKTLKSTGWNISSASKMLDMERTYLYRKIKTYELDKHKDK